MFSNIRDSSSPLAPSTNELYNRVTDPNDPTFSISNYGVNLLYTEGSHTYGPYLNRILPPSAGMSVWIR